MILRLPFLCVLVLLAFGASLVQAVTLEQYISREHPLMSVAGSRLAIGRDGKVYLSSGDYVLRVSRDGTQRLGARVTNATWMVAANTDGVIATANAHFNHSVNMYSPTFTHLGKVSDFLSSDPTEWFGPCDVQAGEHDFYGMDQNRSRIVRVAPPNKMVTTYTLAATGESYVRKLVSFRVWEKGQRFYLNNLAGKLFVIGFDGTLLWSMNTSVGGNPWAGWRGGYDVDDAGNLLMIDDKADVVKIYDVDGKAAGEITLQMGERKGRIADMRVFGDEILIKAGHPREIFQKYQRNTGALLGVVNADVEHLAVNFPDEVWTIGAPQPMSIDFATAHQVAPRWRVWLRPFNTPDYRELQLTGGQLAIPADYAPGLYQLKVSPTVGGASTDYLVQTLVELRQPNSKGTLSIYTPNNRRYYGQGEEIALHLLLRTAEAMPAEVELELHDARQRLTSERIKLQDGKGALAIPGSVTRRLRPGVYTVRAAMQGISVVPQSFVLGAGLQYRSPFDFVQYGDYGFTSPKGLFWETPELVAAHLQRSRKLGVTMFVDRIGHAGAGGLGEITLGNQHGVGTLNGFKTRLEKDPLATAAEKASIEPPLLQHAAAYSAFGMQQMAILMYMDAGLPIGTSFDARTEEQFLDAITRVTNALLPYPSFRGWNWNANWWLSKSGGNAANSPEEKTAYDQALKAATETGLWSPILDQVSDNWLNYATDAYRLFNAKLDELAPGKIKAGAGAYRNIAVYPPHTFKLLDEVDLHYQGEQISPPQVFPHNVDYQKRPGKRAWGHPEFWNDSGTGDYILPTLFQMIMRGTDGIGNSGAIPAWGARPSDARATGQGVPTIFRALNDTLRPYGPWLTTLHKQDQVAIVVSGRMVRIDNWSSIGGRHFTRLYEAYQSCLYAHYPASFVFADDLTPETLKQYRVVLVVGQQVEFEPALLRALQSAKAAGIGVFYDATCREELVKEFTSLGLAFSAVEKDAHAWQDDSAYVRIPGYFKANAPVLARAFAAYCPPVAGVDNPEILMSERASDEGRFLFVVNNIAPALPPGEMWRLSLTMANRMPVLAPVRLNAAGKTVYDVFAMTQVTPQQGVVQADLRSMPARLYAVLPAAIARVGLRGPKSVQAGQALPWEAWVQDARGAAIRANLPVLCRILTADGDVLLEQGASAGVSGAKGDFVVPVNFTGDALTLEVTDMISAKQARLTVAITPARPLSLNADEAIARATVNERAIGDSIAQELTRPEQRFGPHLRDIAISGNLAVMNAMNWDHNLYAIDLQSGRLQWRQRLGHFFAFAPQAIQGGFAVQGFDLHAPEGYHLYLAGDDGKPSRRFALYGLPKRATSWANAGSHPTAINNFATPASGAWIASAGDLGLALWDRDGTLRWSQDWWKTGRRDSPILAALSNDTLVSGWQMTVTGWAAADGTQRWQLTLADTGEIQQIIPAADGVTLAVRSTTEGGRIYLVRDGRQLAAYPTASDALSLNSDGSALCATTGNDLKYFALQGGMQWSFTGDDTLRFPRVTPDGRRIVVTSDIGTVYVLNEQGATLLHRDLGALAVPVWLADGDLLLAGWMGNVTRLDGNYQPRWRTHLQPESPDIRPMLTAKDVTATSKMEGWGNAAAEIGALTPNLLTETRALFTVGMPDRVTTLAVPVEKLVDGDPTPPEEPWLHWTDINYIDSGWRGAMTLTFDTFRTQLRLDGITFHEDPAHPESWMRDAVLQYWDTEREEWINGSSLLSNAAVHTHYFTPPLEAARFRLVAPSSPGTWGAGNIRWGEVVFHGEILGASHPDVVAKRPLAVLFDEVETDIQSIINPRTGSTFSYEGAYSGGKCLRVEAGNSAGAVYRPPFGHAVPNWDFDIAENPQPGQYRFLQFAWKALTPETSGMALLLGRPWPGGGVNFVAGEHKWGQGVIAEKKVTGTPPLEWQVVRVDLWDVLQGKPLRIQNLNLAAVGGAALFDQIVLGRSEGDLPAIP